MSEQSWASVVRHRRRFFLPRSVGSLAYTILVVAIILSKPSHLAGYFVALFFYVGKLA
jgi:hypothetical protein